MWNFFPCIIYRTWILNHCFKQLLCHTLFHFSFYGYLTSIWDFIFFPPNMTDSRAKICHSASLLCKEASFIYFTWTAEIMVQIRRCHHGFSMPLYKEIIHILLNLDFSSFAPWNPNCQAYWGQVLKVISCYWRLELCILLLLLYRSKPWEWKGNRKQSRCPVCGGREFNRNLGGDEMCCNALEKCLLPSEWLQRGISVLSIMKKWDFPYRCTSSYFFYLFWWNDCYLGRRRKGKRGINNQSIPLTFLKTL